IIERRYTATPSAAGRGGQIRVDQQNGGISKITGYGVVFYNAADAGTEYDCGSFKERVDPRACDRAIRERHDARGLFNHDPSNLLGRVGSGTMRLSVDSIGLKYE